MIETILTAAITAVLTGVATFVVQERRLRQELRTEFMAERAAKTLLEAEKWQKRSLDAIQKRLGGFDNDSLRRVLVCAGAVRFESKAGEELWGLIGRNRADL